MSTIFIQYCGAWGYWSIAHALAQALREALNVEVDTTSAGATVKVIIKFSMYPL